MPPDPDLIAYAVPTEVSCITNECFSVTVERLCLPACLVYGTKPSLIQKCSDVLLLSLLALPCTATGPCCLCFAEPTVKAEPSSETLGNNVQQTAHQDTQAPDVQQTDTAAGSVPQQTEVPPATAVPPPTAAAAEATETKSAGSAGVQGGVQYGVDVLPVNDPWEAVEVLWDPDTPHGWPTRTAPWQVRCTCAGKQGVDINQASKVAT